MAGPVHTELPALEEGEVSSRVLGVKVISSPETDRTPGQQRTAQPLAGGTFVSLSLLSDPSSCGRPGRQTTLTFVYSRC